MNPPKQLLLTDHATGLQEVMDLLQAHNCPPIPSTSTKDTISDFNTEDLHVAPKPHHFKMEKETLYFNFYPAPTPNSGGTHTTTSSSYVHFIDTLNKTPTLMLISLSRPNCLRRTIICLPSPPSPSKLDTLSRPMTPMDTVSRQLPPSSRLAISMKNQVTSSNKHQDNILWQILIPYVNTQIPI